MQPILVSDQRCVSVDGWAVGSGRVDTRWFCSGGGGGGVFNPNLLLPSNLQVFFSVRKQVVLECV